MKEIDITKMAYPMRALGKIHVGEREYAAGETFDARTIEAVNYFKKAKAAEVLVKPVAPVDSPVTDNGVVKAQDSEGTAAGPTSDGRGKSDDQPTRHGSFRRRSGK